jgi:peptidoglycan/xylan/chitin deacetylase (PgdA/CDA1 family)
VKAAWFVLANYTALCFGATDFPAASGHAEMFQGGIVRGPTDQKTIALIFTAHEFAEGGEVILDELARHHAKASFFVTGDFLAKSTFSPLIKRIVKEGHYLGPHSDKHLLYCSWNETARTLVSRDQFRADLQANLRKIEAFGVDRSQIGYFLPAYEHYNQEIADWSAELGLRLVNYSRGTRSNADYTGEADTNFVSTKAIFDSIVTREQQSPDGLNGFLLLLHLGAGPGRADKFASRFGELLDYLAGRGYQFVRIDQLLGRGANPLSAGSSEAETHGRADRAPVSASEIFVRANQVGYRPEDPKIAIAFGQSALPDSFAIVDHETGKVCFTGHARAITNVSWGRFRNHVELDFSDWQTPGCYFVRVGSVHSWPFQIRDELYPALPDQLLEFMREQRCGYNPWLDAVCHPFDGRTAYGPLTNGTYLDVRGGWHDAADLLKYLLTSGNATAQMLLAYELGQEEVRGQRSEVRGQKSEVRGQRSGAWFSDKVTALGQQGSNGVPDLLDEGRWGLNWMLKMHPAPDQLYHQVADDRDHIGRRLPQNEVADYGWGKGGARVVYCADGRPQGLQQYQSTSTGMANLAGRYAAAMALAWQIWQEEPGQRSFAERCLQAGKEVYELGRAKEGVQQGNSYKAPYRYVETTWADDMEWGAAELYRGTHEPRYLEDARRYAKLAAAESWMGKEQVGHYQFYPFMNAGHFRLYDLVDPEFQQVLAGYYREGIEACLRAGQKNPYRVGVPFIWCSNNLMVALVTQCLLYERMTGDRRYREFATCQRDWLLGRNPWGCTMFTEIGAVFPKDTHLMTVQLTRRSVRGGLVDGPVYERIFKSLKGVAITEPDPLALFQGPAVYHDDVQDYSSNEPTMDGTASAILMFTLCAR